MAAKRTTTEEFEEAAKSLSQRCYVLRLYVTGTTARSQQAIQNIKRICEEHLKGRYTLEVIDIYQRPILAEEEQIVATPTLVKVLPMPLRRFLGDLSNEERVLVGLDVKPVPVSIQKAKGAA